MGGCVFRVLYVWLACLLVASRGHDGGWGRWSEGGVAKESRASGATAGCRCCRCCYGSQLWWHDRKVRNEAALQLNFLIELDPPIVTNNTGQCTRTGRCARTGRCTRTGRCISTGRCTSTGRCIIPGATATAIPPRRTQYKRLTSIQIGPRRWDARVIPTEIHI